MNEPAAVRENAFWSGICAVLMLGYGWGTGDWLIPDDATPFYESVLKTFDWMLKLGGIGFAVVTLAYVAGIRLALLLDAVVSLPCGLIAFFAAAFWITQDGFGLQYAVFGIFGIGLLNAAKNGVTEYLKGRGVGPGVAKAARDPAAEAPPHPASIRPASLPTADEPPPPEGYLAALAKEKEEPPTASYE